MPDDVAVAGYHLGRSVPADLPSITSTVVADEELGAAAMRRILHRLEQREESYRSILLPTRLMQGETTAAIDVPHLLPSRIRVQPSQAAPGANGRGRFRR